MTVGAAPGGAPARGAGAQAGATVVLATAADDAYALPAAVALLSAATRIGAPGARPACLLLDAGLAAASRAALERAFDAAQVALVVRPAPPLPGQGAGLPAGLPLAACARLRLGELAAELAPRSLYLDADTLTTAPLDALLATPLGDLPFAAVADPAIPRVDHRLGVQGWQRLGIPPEALFFNSGVLLVDNRRWQEAGIGDLAFQRLREGETAAWEQGALNAAAPGRWAPLDARWNTPVPNAFMLPLLGGRALTKGGLRPPLTPGILHFTGRIKPWQAGYPPNPARAAYLRAWRKLLPGEARPRTRGLVGWPVARLAGRLSER